MKTAGTIFNSEYKSFHLKIIDRVALGLVQNDGHGPKQRPRASLRSDTRAEQSHSLQRAFYISLEALQV